MRWSATGGKLTFRVAAIAIAFALNKRTILQVVLCDPTQVVDTSLSDRGLGCLKRILTLVDRCAVWGDIVQIDRIRGEGAEPIHMAAVRRDRHVLGVAFGCEAGTPRYQRQALDDLARLRVELERRDYVRDIACDVEHVLFRTEYGPAGFVDVLWRRYAGREIRGFGQLAGT